MAKYASDSALFFLDGYNLTGYSTSLELETRAPAVEETVLGDTWREYTCPAIREADISHEGFYDSTGSDPALVGVGTEGSGLALFAGNTVGNKCVGLKGILRGGYTRTATIGDYHKAKGIFNVSGIVEEGKVQDAHGAHTSATGDSAAINNTASSADGGSAYIQVTDLTLGGYTSVTVKLVHSEDNVTYTDVSSGAFTNITLANVDQRITFTGTLNQYTKCRYTFNGTGTGQSITYIVALVRN